MSLEGVTDATAKVLASVTGMKAAYASTAGGQGDTVKAMPNDVSDTPVAFVTHAGFTLLTASGSFEKLRHTVVADLYFNAASPASAEYVALPLISRCFAAFRLHVGLYGEGTIATMNRGGPPRTEEVNGKNYMVYPLFIDVLEAGVQTYTA